MTDKVTMVLSMGGKKKVQATIDWNKATVKGTPFSDIKKFETGTRESLREAQVRFREAPNEVRELKARLG